MDKSITSLISNKIKIFSHDFFGLLLPGFFAIFYFFMTWKIFGFSNGQVVFQEDEISKIVNRYAIEHQLLCWIFIIMFLSYLCGFLINTISKYKTMKTLQKFFKIKRDSKDYSQIITFLRQKFNLTYTPEWDIDYKIFRTKIYKGDIDSLIDVFQTKYTFYRCMGFIFALSFIMDIILFLRSLIIFDLSLLGFKISVIFFNLLFAYLFTRSYAEFSDLWKQQLIAESVSV